MAEINKGHEQYFKAFQGFNGLDTALLDEVHEHAPELERTTDIMFREEAVVGQRSFLRDGVQGELVMGDYTYFFINNSFGK